jgi:hypothetical protein
VNGRSTTAVNLNLALGKIEAKIEAQSTPLLRCYVSSKPPLTVTLHSNLGDFLNMPKKPDLVRLSLRRGRHRGSIDITLAFREIKRNIRINIKRILCSGLFQLISRFRIQLISNLILLTATTFTRISTYLPLSLGPLFFPDASFVSQ